VRVGRFLTGESKLWFDNWSPTTRNWATFKREFLESFPPKKILGKLLHEASVCRSADFNTYGAYVHKKLAMLKNLRAHWSESDLVELITYGIDEGKVQEAVSIRNFDTVSNLIAYLSSVEKPQTKRNSDVSVPFSKRVKWHAGESASKALSCFQCGRIGHKQRQCHRFPKSNNKLPIASAGKQTSRVETSDPTRKCSFCFKTGHLEPDCFIKKGIDDRKNVCFVSSGKTTTPTLVKIVGKNYMGLIDTGADMFLMSDEFLELFSHKLTPHQFRISGISAGNVLSHYKFEANVEITGTLKSTPTPWLHVLAHIIPYDIRRKYVTKRIWDKFQNSPNMYSVTQDMANLPPFRLKSRKPLWKEEFLMEPFSKSDYWKAAWQDVDIFNKNLIEDPTKQLPGFDLPRKIWCKLNRFRTGHGKCNNMLFHWNIRENPSCECGAEKETIQHIVEECPLNKFQQGFSKLHLLTEDALNWLQQIKNI
jgi:hypothetical protein